MKSGSDKRLVELIREQYEYVKSGNCADCGGNGALCKRYGRLVCAYCIEKTITDDYQQFQEKCGYEQE